MCDTHLHKKGETLSPNTIVFNHIKVECLLVHIIFALYLLLYHTIYLLN